MNKQENLLFFILSVTLFIMLICAGIVLFRSQYETGYYKGKYEVLEQKCKVMESVFPDYKPASEAIPTIPKEFLP